VCVLRGVFGTEGNMSLNPTNGGKKPTPASLGQSRMEDLASSRTGDVESVFSWRTCVPCTVLVTVAMLLEIKSDDKVF
jgi:hypothetical protein